MNWEEHTPHKHATDSKQFYCLKDTKDTYVAYIIHTEHGYQATVPSHEAPPRGETIKYYHYTHDTLQEAKDWCIAELWKRRLDQ